MIATACQPRPGYHGAGANWFVAGVHQRDEPCRESDRAAQALAFGVPPARICLCDGSLLLLVAVADSQAAAFRFAALIAEEDPALRIAICDDWPHSLAGLNCKEVAGVTAFGHPNGRHGRLPA